MLETFVFIMLVLIGLFPHKWGIWVAHFRHAYEKKRSELFRGDNN